MRAALVLGLAACAASSGTPASETFVKQHSHAVLDAYDRGDLAVVSGELAPGYVHFEGGEPTTRDAELAEIAKRKPDAPHIGTREWLKEYTFVHGDDAVFFGRALEHAAGNDTHGGFRYEGWYTLHWRRVGARWQLALWTWQRAGKSAERDRWNTVFLDGVGFDKRPNQLLVDTVAGVTPGNALDVAMGQGRNALYLASQGWQVTGVDWSDTGIRIAREAADSRGLHLETVDADLDTYDFGSAKWDLVTMIYAGDDPEMVRKLQQSLKPSGLFVLEYFHDNDTLKPNDGSFARGELAALFANGFDIVRDDVVDAVPDWRSDRASLVRFVARKR